MTHARLVEMAEAWLRRARCGIVLSEQGCSSGEMPDAVGWKGRGMLRVSEMPDGWGLLEAEGRELMLAKKSKRKLRQPEGLTNEMNLLLASLRRVEVRIEPQRIGDFLKWKNRLASYNGGPLPAGIVAPEEEENSHLV
jgi:hypothetical protein